MTIDELKFECAEAGFGLRKCSDTHYQIHDEAGALIDVWPTTNKYRWHGANESQKAKNGSAHKAVQQALFTASRRGSVIDGSFKVDRDSQPRPQQSDTRELADVQRARIHLLTLTVTRLRFYGSAIDEALADEIESVL